MQRCYILEYIPLKYADILLLWWLVTKFVTGLCLWVIYVCVKRGFMFVDKNSFTFVGGFTLVGGFTFVRRRGLRLWAYTFMGLLR